MTTTTILPESPEGEKLTIEDLTRREFVAGAFGATLFIACGDDDEKSPTPATRTRRIDTAWGEVEIPAQPERVVAVSIYSLYVLLGLGFEPVGVPENLLPALPEERAIYDAAGKIGPLNEIDVERVAAMAPDLILGVAGTAEITGSEAYFTNLQNIAPTALFELAGTNDWMDVSERFADAVGMADRISIQRETYETRAAGIRSTYSATLAGTRWAIANEFQDGWVLWFPDSSAGQVLSAAGVEFVSAATNQSGNFSQFPLEQLNELSDADLILVRSAESGVLGEGSQEWLDLPAFAALREARGTQAFALAWLFPYSYSHALALLDEVEGVLRRL